MKNYTTEAKIENYLGGSIGESYDTLVTDTITNAEIFIDNYTKKYFDLKTARTVTLDGNGSDTLVLPERLVTLTTLTLDTSVYTDTTYNYNWRLKLKTGYFPAYPPKAVVILGSWGYSAVPADIEEACTMICAEWLRPFLSEGVPGIESISDGQYNVRYTLSQNPYIREILDRYRRDRIA